MGRRSDIALGSFGFLEGVEPFSAEVALEVLVSDCGTAGRGFIASGKENADPISESVSERACTFMPGAMAGMCSVVDDIRAEPLLFRKASARRSSTIVLSSLIASSTSIFARLGSVSARGRLELEVVLDPIDDNLCGEYDRELYKAGDD